MAERGDGMSVLIKDMEMPERCGQCFLRVGNCKQRIYMEQRPKGCPLVELPPHGRLIDADELAKHKYENIWTNRLIIDADDLDDATTVIEAEGSGI